MSRKKPTNCSCVNIYASSKLTNLIVSWSRTEIEKKLLEDEEVFFAWSIASGELDDKTGTILDDS